MVSSTEGLTYNIKTTVGNSDMTNNSSARIIFMNVLNYFMSNRNLLSAD